MQVMPTRVSGDITYEKRTDVGQVADGVGSRTHEGLSPLPVFKTGAFNRSATHPDLSRLITLPYT